MKIFWYNSHSPHSKARKPLKISAKLESCCSYSQKVKKLLFLCIAWAFPFARRANSHPEDEQNIATIFQLMEKGQLFIFHSLSCISHFKHQFAYKARVLPSIYNEFYIHPPSCLSYKEMWETDRSVFIGLIVANVVGENKEEHNMQGWKCSVNLSSKMGHSESWIMSEQFWMKI